MEAINTIEITVNIFLQSLGTWLQIVMEFITNLGSEMFFIIAMPALYWCVDAYIGLRVAMMLLLSGALNNFFKLLFRTPRPYWTDSRVIPVVHESSFGLPSGHSMYSASVWGWMAVEAKKRWAAIVCIIIIFLIGLSRLVMGVHFLSDVLSGWLLGGLLVWVFSKVQKPVGKRLNKLKINQQVILAFATSIILFLLCLFARNLYPDWVLRPDWAARAGEIDSLSVDGTLTMAGTWFGMLGGFAIMRYQYGILITKAPAIKLLARYIVGLIGVFIIYMGLGQAFEALSEIIANPIIEALLRYIRYALIGFWVSLLAPLIFKRFNLAELDIPLMNK